MEYESVAKRAQRTGEPPIGPVNANTPAPSGAGVTRTQTGASGPRPDLMSSGEPADVIGTARSVAGRVSVVHTLPARALADLAFSVAAVAARHGIDRDGACAACGWTYPCPDRLTLDAALRAAYDTVNLGGAA